jgi:hypothetical protein
MAEHVPPRVLVALMAVFFAVMTVAALAFWAAAVVVPGGISGVIGLIGYATMTIFGTFHILAAVTGVLLWQWERHRLRPLMRSRWRRRRSISASPCWCRSSSTCSRRRSSTESSSASAALPYLEIPPPRGRHPGPRTAVIGTPSIR